MKKTIKKFTFPFGKYNKQTLDILKKAGYSFGFTTKPFFLSKKLSPFELPRFVVNKFSSLVFENIFIKGYGLYWRVYFKLFKRRF